MPSCATGKQLPARQIDIDAMSLLIQDGPERAWNWTNVGTVRLHAAALGVAPAQSHNLT
jgi:hypothetical protein